MTEQEQEKPWYTHCDSTEPADLMETVPTLALIALTQRVVEDNPGAEMPEIKYRVGVAVRKGEVWHEPAAAQ